MVNDAIILCGGLATRMGSVCDAVPKCMLPVGDKPFLDTLVRWLLRNHMGVVLSCGHHDEIIKDHFTGPDWLKSGIRFVDQPTPLPETGGAIRQAAAFARSEHFLVLNGDTIVSFDIARAFTHHASRVYPVTQLLSKSSNQNQGLVTVDPAEQIVVDFDESGSPHKRTLARYIDACSTGAYIVNRDFVIARFEPEARFSWEREAMPELVQDLEVGAHMITQGVIDFGTPMRYRFIMNLDLDEYYGN